MKRIKDLPIKKKLFLGFFLVIGLFFLLGIYFFYITREINKSSRYVELRNFPEVELITEIQRSMLTIQNLEHQIPHLAKREEALIIRDTIAKNVSKADVLISELVVLVADEPDILISARKVKDLFGKYISFINREIDGILNENIYTVNPEKGGVSVKLVGALEDMRNEQVAVFSSKIGSIYDLAANTRNMYVWLLAVIIAIAVWVVFRITGFIIRPVNVLLLGMRKLGEGNLDYKIEVNSTDELGDLQKGFVTMGGRLKDAYTQLQKEKDELDAKVKERTKQLELSQVYLKMTTDGIEEGILLVDTGYNILWANERVIKDSQMTADMILSKKCYDIMHGSGVHPLHSCPLNESLKTHKPATATHIHTDAAGNSSYFEIAVYPIFDENGNLTRFVHVTRDISDKKKAEERLTKYVSSLELVQKELQAKIDELEKFTQLAIGRELKMIELKKKIKELENRAGKTGAQGQ